LTPYELRTITRGIADLEQPASLVEVFGSIRDLDERGELELSWDEIREVIDAMLNAEYLVKERVKPYEKAKANITFYTLNQDLEDVRSALEVT
jgi:hypothetical protein